MLLQQISDMPVLDARIVIISFALSDHNDGHLNQNIYVRYLGLIPITVAARSKA
jgi:hypothetical protein